jgi:hypothetical protein
MTERRELYDVTEVIFLLADENIRADLWSALNWRLRSGFLVSDAGAARREAGLLGGERAFQRIAQDVAKRFGIRFDHNMIFDLDVGETELVPAVMAVANAAKTAVENTAIHLAATEHADHRAYLWDSLQGVYGSAFSQKPVTH